jgi:hypothetical protein
LLWFAKPRAAAINGGNIKVVDGISAEHCILYKNIS